MKNKTSRNILISILLVLALGLIVIGAKMAWDSFRIFEGSVVDEKDSLLYNTTVSIDAGLANEMDTFVRECDNAFKSTRMTALEKEWVNNQKKDQDNNQLASDIRYRFKRTTLVQNPVISFVKVSSGDKTIYELNGDEKYETIAETKSGVNICVDENKGAYLSYVYKSKRGFSYKAVMSLSTLYTQYANASYTSIENLYMYYPESNILLTDETGALTVVDLEQTGDKYEKVIRLFSSCREKKVSDADTLVHKSSKNEDEKTDLRMYVLTSDKRKNCIFDIGATASYAETISPSTDAAKNMLMYAAFAGAGIAIILIVLFLIARSNMKKNEEVENLRRRNEQMEEINRQMQIVAHHQRLETIGTMTAGLAHDFNNLLTPIMGYSLMSMEMLDQNSDIYDNLLEIYNSSCKAKDIVTRLAELSRKGKSENNTVFSIDDVVDGTMKTTLPAKPKVVKLHGELDARSACIRADETQISQLVLNLILNAYDALEECGGEVRVETYIDKENAIIIVQDNGPGMDAQVISKIFDPFFTTKESGKGTGLGLAICQQIAETYKGKIYVDSELGKGTTFKVSFPIVDKHEAVE